MNSKLYKLAKLVLNLAEIETDKAKLIIDGEPEIGKEAFIEDENAELVAPEDGEYVAENQILVIADGKIAEINEKETEEQPEEQPAEVEQEEEQPENEPEEQEQEPDEKDKRIAELEAQIEELNQVIVEKDELIGELKAELEKSDSKPAEEELKSQKQEQKSWFKYNRI